MSKIASTIGLPEGRYVICDPAELPPRDWKIFMKRFTLGPAQPGVLDIVPELDSIIVPVEGDGTRRGVLSCDGDEGMLRAVGCDTGLLGIIPASLVDDDAIDQEKGFPVIFRGPVTAEIDDGILKIRAQDDDNPDLPILFSLALDHFSEQERLPEHARPDEVAIDVLNHAAFYLMNKGVLTEIRDRLGEDADADISRFDVWRLVASYHGKENTYFFTDEDIQEKVSAWIRKDISWVTDKEPDLTGLDGLEEGGENLEFDIALPYGSYQVRIIRGDIPSFASSLEEEVRQKNQPRSLASLCGYPRT